MLKCRGFTLTELLVVTGVMIALSLAVLVNWKGSGQEFALQRSANKLAQDLRKASNMAMSAKEFQGSVPLGGYGIFLKVRDHYYILDYILYADTNPVGGNQAYEAGDGQVETIYEEQGVYIQDIFSSSLSINFKPPSPTIRIVKADGTELAQATIILALQSDPTKTKTIRVNTAGLITVE